jgi:hypothetical protein
MTMAAPMIQNIRITGAIRAKSADGSGLPEFMPAQLAFLKM